MLIMHLGLGTDNLDHGKVKSSNLNRELKPLNLYAKILQRATFTPADARQIINRVRRQSKFG
jgi:hypothetical protein